MTRRPNPFNQQALEDSLRELGCPESFISTIVSNYRLFVPLLFAEMGEERVFETVYRARHELGLGDQEAAWRFAVKYIVAWAEQMIDDYKSRRANTILPALEEEEDLQPRLL